MSNLVSNDVATSGIWRATIISEVGPGVYKIYIPALHKSNIPFVVNGTEVSTEVREVVEGMNSRQVYQGITLGPNDYPSANSCVWQSQTTLQPGDSVWVMFENGDINYPVIMGQLGSSAPVSYNSGGGNVVGSGYLSGYGDYVDVPEDMGIFETYEREIRNNNETHGWAKWGNDDASMSRSQGGLRYLAIQSGRQKRGNIFGLQDCAIIDNRLQIATVPNIGNKLSVQVGDYLDVEFADGTVWNCILADTKGAGVDSIWGHNGGQCVVEIIYWTDDNNSGNQYKKVKRITKVGNYIEGIVDPTAGNDMQEKVAAFASTFTGVKTSVSSKPLYCQAWVSDVYRICTGTGDPGQGDASNAGRNHRVGNVSSNGSNVPLGAAIYSIQKSGPGHVEIYIGNGKVVSNLFYRGKFTADSGHWTNNNPYDEAGNFMKKPSIETVEEYRSWAKRSSGFEAFVWGWPGDVDLTKLNKK